MRQARYGLRGDRVGEASHPGPSCEVESVFPTRVDSETGIEPVADVPMPELHVLSQGSSGSDTESVEMDHRTTSPLPQIGQRVQRRRLRLRWSFFFRGRDDQRNSQTISTRNTTVTQNASLQEAGQITLNFVELGNVPISAGCTWELQQCARERPRSCS